MPLQLKKRDAAPATAPAWHPNFRNFERLPDTKVVRTTFFINVGSGVLALVLTGIVGWREYQALNLRDQHDAAVARIEQNRAQNAESLRLNKVFADEEKKFAEAADFIRTPLTTTEMIRHFGESLPRDIQLEYLDLRPLDAANPQCAIRGIVSGTKDQASGAASAYVEALRTHPRFAEVFSSVELRSINPDPRGGALIFEIVMKFKTETRGRKQ